MDNKKDINTAREIFIKGISRASFVGNKKLSDIFSFIVEELDKQHPEDKNRNIKLN